MRKIIGINMSEYSASLDVPPSERSLIQKELIKDALINQGYSVSITDAPSIHPHRFSELRSAISELDIITKGICLGIPTGSSVTIKSSGQNLFHLIFNY